MFARFWLGWLLAGGIALAAGDVLASPESDAASAAAGWLAANQNGDGSWGVTEDVRPVYTAAVVNGLRAQNDRGAAYFAGIAWLENHAMYNVDYHARRIAALAPHGDDISLDRDFLKQSFSTVSGGDAAWGLSDIYIPAPRDTALALQAFGVIGVAADVASEVQSALDYLQSSQAVDGSWALTGGSVANVTATAEAIRALKPHTAIDAGVVANGDLGVTYLLANVSAASTELEQAQASLAVLRWTPGSAAADALITSLVGDQLVDGSWSGDALLTGLALEVMAAKEGTDTAFYQERIAIGDFGLRSAVNLAIGRNRGDVLRRGDLQSLTSLDASGFAISDLTGLEEATNLAYLDLRDTNVSDITPILALPTSTKILLQNTPWAGLLCDVNDNGVLDAADGMMATRISVGHITPTLLQRTKSDVAPTSGPGDGIVDPTDVILVMRWGVGHSVPVCN
jgi:hypothetical protein